jgi:spermidine/putrescine transport system permease protein
MNLRAIATSFKVAISVSMLSVVVGTMAAFLFEQENFKFKGALYFLMIAPLVIPGVILGISILLFSASDLGANRFEVIRFITLQYLKPSIIGGAAIAFLMSFENFNTTTFLISSQPTLPIILYQQVRDGSTPVINAISFILIVSVSIIAVANLYYGKKEKI